MSEEVVYVTLKVRSRAYRLLHAPQNTWKHYRILRQYPHAWSKRRAMMQSIAWAMAICHWEPNIAD